MPAFEQNNKFEAALKLLKAESTTKEKFESIRILLKDLNPKTDKLLSSISQTISKIENLEKGDLIQLSADNLPESSEEEKRRKKAILLLIKYWKGLEDEVARVKNELSSNQGNVQKTGRLIRFVKGPFGIVTILAVVIVAGSVFINANKSNRQAVSEQTPEAVGRTSAAKIKVIDVNGKKIPLDALTTGIGPECLTGSKEAYHYHAKDHTSAKSTDGSTVTDPGGCGFGKVDEVKIEEIKGQSL
jgi:hypothetical protein